MGSSSAMPSTGVWSAWPRSIATCCARPLPSFLPIPTRRGPWSSMNRSRLRESFLLPSRCTLSTACWIASAKNWGSQPSQRRSTLLFPQAQAGGKNNGREFKPQGLKPIESRDHIAALKALRQPKPGAVNPQRRTVRQQKVETENRGLALETLRPYGDHIYFAVSDGAEGV